MGFRENLKNELFFQDIRIKELAYKSGINPRTIEQYLSSAAKMPSAENAVKIASALNVSVEQLVTGKASSKDSISPDIRAMITKMNKFSPEEKQVIFDIVDVLAKK